MRKVIKFDQNDNKGITLIALVITIIVLLILAGISIATLIGENGILNKANTAKEKTEIADIIEQARIDILGVQVENQGNISKGNLIEILNKYFEDVPQIEEFPDDLTTIALTSKNEYGKHEIKVSDIYKGKLSGEDVIIPTEFNPNTLTIGTAINTDKYGWKVKNYTVKTTEFTTGVWRLFYQDNKYAYLITDECVGTYRPSDYYSKYENGTSVSTVGQKLNSTISALFVESNTNPNIRATAWLTDTSDEGMWKDYKNSDSIFAIRSSNIRIIGSIL